MAETIDYANAFSGQKRAGNGAALLCLTGLGPVFFGGCFMIGVLTLVVDRPGPNTGPNVWALRHELLGILLTVMGVVCFVGGAVLIFLGVARVFRRPQNEMTIASVRGQE